VARVEYRGDILQFRLVVPSTEVDAMSATWSLNDDLGSLVGALR
jgi:hypothetical protein